MRYSLGVGKPKAIKRLARHYDITPTTSYRHRQVLMGDYLDKLIGTGSERALQAVLAIAEARCKIPEDLDTQLARIADPAARAAYLKTVAPPDWTTRLAAYNLLLAYHQGRPRQQIEITQEELPTPQVDLNRLSHADKLTLLELLGKAKPAPSASESVVDAEVVSAESGGHDDEF